MTGAAPADLDALLRAAAARWTASELVFPAFLPDGWFRTGDLGSWTRRAA
ncbi:hypothetical protein [Baekduia soli]|nr:hypothetical protein [Baekduia soli]